MFAVVTALCSQSAFMLLERRDNSYSNVALRITTPLRIPLGPKITKSFLSCLDFFLSRKRVVDLTFSVLVASVHDVLDSKLTAR